MLVNLTKGEYIRADSSKLLEIAGDRRFGFIFTGLLAGDSNGLGCGDLDDHPNLGRWATDSIVLAGDYGAPGLYVNTVASSLGRRVSEDDIEMNLYHYMTKYGTNITAEALEMAEDLHQ